MLTKEEDTMVCGDPSACIHLRVYIHVLDCPTWRLIYAVLSVFKSWLYRVDFRCVQDNKLDFYANPPSRNLSGSIACKVRLVRISKEARI